MRYTKELRIRYKGDPDLCAKYIPEARKYIAATLQDVDRRDGPSVGARKLQNAEGVVFRVLSMGSVPIVEIDVRAVPPPEPAIIPDKPAFIVWPSPGAGSLHANGDYPQVIINYATDHWRAAYYNSEFKPPGAQGIAYQPTFPDGVTGMGNVDWVSADGKWGVSWYGPRTRYFMDRSRSSFIGEPFDEQRFYGEFRFRGEIFVKGKLLVDVKQQSVALVGEADVYVKGACLRVIDGTLYLFCVIAKLGGDNSQGYDWEYDMREWVLRYTVTPNDRTAPVYEADTESAEVIGSYEGNFEYEADHPWFFNGDGTEARTLRKKDATDFSVAYQRELSLTIELDTSAFGIVEDALIEPNVITEINDNQTNWFVHPVGIEMAVIVEGEAVLHSTAQPLDQSNPLNDDYLANDDAIGSDVSPLMGSQTLNTHLTYEQTPVKAAVDWRDDEWVYAYALGIEYDFQSTHFSRRTFSVAAYYSRFTAFPTSFEVIGRGDGEFNATEEMTGSTGGLQFDDVTLKSSMSGSLNTAYAGDWDHYHSGTLNLAAAKLSGSFARLGGGIVTHSAGTVSRESERTTLHILHLDLRFGLVAALEVKSINQETRTMSYEYSGPPAGHISASTTPNIANFTMPYSVHSENETKHVYRFFAGGKEVRNVTITDGVEVDDYTDEITPYTRSINLLHTYSPGTGEHEIVPAEVRSFIPHPASYNEDQGNYILDVAALPSPTGGALGWQRYTNPYFLRYETFVEEAEAGIFTAGRKDHYGFAHYGHFAGAPKKPVYVASFALMWPDNQTVTWESLLYDGDLSAVTDYPVENAFAPITYLPPTKFVL